MTQVKRNKLLLISYWKVLFIIFLSLEAIIYEEKQKRLVKLILTNVFEFKLQTLEQKNTKHIRFYIE